MALLIPLLAVSAGLNGPDDLCECEELKSFGRKFIPIEAWLRFLMIAEAQSDDNGRKIETKVSVWEDMPGSSMR